MASHDYFNGPGGFSARRHGESTSHTAFDTPRKYPEEEPRSPSSYASQSYKEYGNTYYNDSRNSLQSPPYAPSSMAYENEHNTFRDDIPLRQHVSKEDEEIALQNHLPEDPTVVDRPVAKDRKHRNEQKGFFAGGVPWVVYTLTAIQIIVFIVELIKNGLLTGSPIEIHPQFNPMIGPSPYVLINMGARYVICMRASDASAQPATVWPCPNITSSNTFDPSYSCSLNQLCGFNDRAYSADKPPHQWFRFIIPMFLHAGFIHIGFNMLLQLLLGSDMEKQIGPLRFFLVYISSGIFGFVLGGNLAPPGIASTGASGSLFGVIALLLLDLLYHWGERPKPWVDLAWIIVDVVICFVLGLLPGLDNFSHIGGFLMGLVLGICLLHSPEVLRRRTGIDEVPYGTTSSRSGRHATNAVGLKGFAKEPLVFFRGRKPLWWAWWLVRAAALIGVLGGFIALIQNFYKANPTTCSWCKYLSCLNIKGWCDIGNATTFTSVSNRTGPSSTSPNKRDFLSLALPIDMRPYL